MSHEPRISWSEFQRLAPDVVAGFRSVQKAINASGLEHTLTELVKVRASQINGCAFCLEMHTADARKVGVSDEKLHLVAVWQEASNVFTERESAALAWTDSLTLIDGENVDDSVYEALLEHFSESEIANLTAAVALINAWNRIAKPLRYSLQGLLAK